MAAEQAGDKRHDVFDVDEERALGALRLVWGDAYTVCFDDAIGVGGDRWQAWRLDGDGSRLAGSTADELNAAIRADCASRSLP
jgi:hypothetical protein